MKTPERCLHWCAAIAVSALAALPTLAADPAALVVQTLDGSSFDLAHERGRVVLVHYWATWCVPCREEMPALEAFYRKYREHGLDVIALSVDRGRDLDEVRRMMGAYHFPAAMARGARQNSFGSQSALPVTFVLDGGGVIRAEMRPDREPVTEAMLEKVVGPLLR